MDTKDDTIWLIHFTPVEHVMNIKSIDAKF